MHGAAVTCQIPPTETLRTPFATHACGQNGYGRPYPQQKIARVQFSVKYEFVTQCKTSTIRPGADQMPTHPKQR